LPSTRAAKQQRPPEAEKKLMPWEGGEPTYVDWEPLNDPEMDAFFRARDRGWMTPQQRWLCVLKAHEIRGSDGTILRF
jgi:hypothetical protein